MLVITVYWFPKRLAQFVPRKKLEGKGEMREIVNGYNCTIDAVTYFLSFKNTYFSSNAIILVESLAFQRDFLLYLMTWLFAVYLAKMVCILVV